MMEVVIALVWTAVVAGAGFALGYRAGCGDTRAELDEFTGGDA